MLRELHEPGNLLEDVTLMMDSLDHGQEEHNNNTDPLDDVFGSPPSSPTMQSTELAASPHRAPPSGPSDIPRLRSLHVTSGYREGITASKEQHVQAGFDEGYSLGAELGLKAGWILGALEGIWHALAGKELKATREPKDQSTIKRDMVFGMLQEAERELTVQSLFGKDYFGADGVWVYHVSAQGDEEEDVTFEQVASAHPALRKWTDKVHALALSHGLDLHQQSAK